MSSESTHIEAGYELTWAARRHRHRVALGHDARELTFAEVDAAANRLANALIGMGLAINDRVAVLLPNCPECVVVQFGAAKAGTTLVTLNARHSALEHARILADSEPRLIIVGARFEDVIGDALEALDRPVPVAGVGWRGPAGSFDELLRQASDTPPGVLVDPDRDVVRLFYTSGTTGEPKGIVVTHGQYHARLRNFFGALEYALGVEHSMVHVGPLTHAAGNYIVPYFMRGARSLIHTAFDPPALLDTIEREKVNHLLLVPTMITRLLEHVRPGSNDLASISRINYGTAPIPVRTLGLALEVFGPVFRQHYGLSECQQPVTVLYPHEHHASGPSELTGRLASCGQPVCGQEVAVDEGTGPTRDPDVVGEIVIRARGAVAADVWRKPDQRERMLRDGWLRTGDLGRFDADGYLYIVGRTKDMIISGGFNVYAREVEEPLLHHPAVLEAAVFGVPDPEWGERICAYVGRREGHRVAPQELIEHCRHRIAGYKLPRHVVILEHLPKNANGKLDKNDMRRHFVAAHGADPDALGLSVLARYDD